MQHFFTPVYVNLDVFPFTPADHSLFINCGGPEIDEYKGDETQGGPSHFFSFPHRWAYSLTGSYMDNEDRELYRVVNTNATSGIFQTARIAPLSLNYFGRCLRKGSYKVTLHFAEIEYSEDQTFSSLGKRVFDISIQVS